MAAPGYEALLEYLAIRESDWMMSPSERLAVVGVLAILRPMRTLEIGYRFGGCTSRLSAYSGSVVTVDIDERVKEASSRFPNVVPMHMTSGEALRRLSGDREHFDLCVVDGDHSETGAHDDLKGVLSLADVILVHDTANPDCRKGYARVLSDSGVYGDLDLVDGRLQVDGPWGGIGLVLPGFGSGQARHHTPSVVSSFELLSAEIGRRRSRWGWLRRKPKAG
jgi:hypothetical protein